MATKPSVNAFRASKAAENRFLRALKKVGRTSGHIVEAHVDGHELKDEAAMKRALAEYSKLIGPWAARQSAKMLEAVSRNNRTAYAKQSKLMGRLLRTNVAEADVGRAALRTMNEQVGYIQSIPLDAGLRAQALALQASIDGTRASEVAEELQRSTGVSERKAELIARTEVARANASINEARAKAVGSQQYIWRNSGDEAVRESHRRYHGKKLDGMVFSWSNPPTLDDGTTGHPGTFPNCRCYAEPFFPDE